MKPLVCILSPNLHLLTFITVLKMRKKRRLPPVISCSCTLCLSHTMGHCLLPLYSLLIVAPIYINIINLIFTLLASTEVQTALNIFKANEIKKLCLFQS